MVFESRLVSYYSLSKRTGAEVFVCATNFAIVFRHFWRQHGVCNVKVLGFPQIAPYLVMTRDTLDKDHVVEPVCQFYRFYVVFCQLENPRVFLETREFPVCHSLSHIIFNGLDLELSRDVFYPAAETVLEVRFKSIRF